MYLFLFRILILNYISCKKEFCILFILFIFIILVGLVLDFWFEFELGSRFFYRGFVFDEYDCFRGVRG